MIAEVCRTYHWTVDYCLEMPAVQFFSCLKHSRLLRAWDRLDDCDIAAIPACNDKYFAQVRKRYERTIKFLSEEDMKPKIEGQPEVIKQAPVDDDNVRYAVMSMFTKMKRH